MKEELKDRLKAAMNSKGIKAIELCEKTGIPSSAMSYYLNGRMEPKSDRLYIIAKALDVSEAWLLGYSVAQERSPDQKDNDELADLAERIKKDRDFRQLMFAINHLNPSQVDLIRNLVSQLQKNPEGS
jgi:transcriptional regulator with XRE-family HTH domain